MKNRIAVAGSFRLAASTAREVSLREGNMYTFYYSSLTATQGRRS
jgi:hypothetical protein